MGRQNHMLLAAWLGLAVLCFSQTAPVVPRTGETDIATAAKSPEGLARFLESHRIDWKALRNALGLKESAYWLAPCGSDFPAAEAPCSTETVTVLNPDQAILIIRGGVLSYTLEYLRYLKDPKSGWRFAGENNAFQRNSPSHHKVTRIFNKPFLMISSDHSQNGFATQQVLEDWFDLTMPDFEPVFSATIDGSQGRFGLGVGRTMHATLNPSELAGVERVDLILTVHFVGAGLNQEAVYLGIHERAANEETFTLRSAYAGLDRRTAIALRDFEDLADPFSGLSNEKLLTYALPGLQRVATGSDSDAKEWLRSVLNNAQDTPEKRTLLKLLRER